MKKWLKHEVSPEFTLALARLQWKMRRFFAILGIIAMLGSLLPNIQKTYAYALPEETTREVSSTPVEYPTTTDDDFDISSVALLGEVESMRTENAKTFQRVDGSFAVALYSDAVHYQKNGKWENIDNTLSLDSGDDSYTNQANQFTVKFPKKLEENKDIKLIMDDYAISWSILGTSKTNIVVADSAVKTNNMKELTGINQEVTYANVMSGVDVQYILSGSKVKENIVLDHYIQDFSMTFEYSVKNLALVETKGSYSFVNENGDVIFDFSDLYAMDAQGETTGQVRINVAEVKKDTYLVVLSLDNEWAKEAIYPITIDPSIQLPSDGYIRDTYLREGSSASYYTSTYITCGEYFFTDYLGYLDFTVPTYLKNYDVIYATLSLTRYDGTSTLYLHELNTYYGNFSTLTWNTRPTPGQELIDFAYFNSSTSEYKLDITQSVDKWNKLGLSEMYGFELSTNGGRNRPRSIDSSVSSPTIEIGFIDSNGIKDYWTYNAQEVSYAGTGYISDYTQELYFVRNDISFQTDLQTLGVSFVFNNNMAISSTPNIGYGNGWNISYNLKIYSDSPNTLYYSIDNTGNRITYYPTTCDSRTPSDFYTAYSCYLSDDGSGSKLVNEYDFDDYLQDVFILTSDNTKYSFNTTSLDLIYISSLNNDLSTTISRVPENRDLIKYVLDERGNEIEFNYDTSGNLESATLKTKDEIGDMHELEKVYYGYSPTTQSLVDVYFLKDYDQNEDLTLNLDNLSNVDQIVHYVNVESGLLTYAYVNYLDENLNQITGEEVHYHYYSSIDPAVSYFESYYKSTKYSEVHYDYVENQTMISDFAGNFCYTPLTITVIR